VGSLVNFRKLVIGIGFAAIACAPVVSETIDTVDTGFSLSEKNGTCFLTYTPETGGSALTRELSAPAPCFFAKNEDGARDIRSYPEQGVDSLYVVIGGVLDAETREAWGLSTEQRCGHTVQGVSILDDGVWVAPTTLEEGVWCAEASLDEMVFRGFALQAKR